MASSDLLSENTHNMEKEEKELYSEETWQTLSQPDDESYHKLWQVRTLDWFDENSVIHNRIAYSLVIWTISSEEKTIKEQIENFRLKTEEQGQNIVQKKKNRAVKMTV